MKYFLIRNVDGDTFVSEINREEILRDLDEYERNADDFLDKAPDSDTNYWGEGKCLLIRGEIVTPQKKEVAIKHDLP